MSEARYAGALEAIDRIVNRGGESEEVLRSAIEVLHARLGWPAQVFVMHCGELVPGPVAGSAGAEAARSSFPIALAGADVGRLDVADEPDAAGRAFLERVATLISPYCRWVSSSA